MLDIETSLICGNPVPLPEIQLIAYSPTIKEICMMGETDYFTAMHLLCLEKENLVQDKTLLSNLNNFQVFMKVLGEPNFAEKKQNVIELLHMIFKDSGSIIFTPRSIIFKPDAETTVMIDENNFDLLQSYLKRVLCAHSLFQGNNVVYNPGSKKAKEIADKIMRGRKKAAEINAGGKQQRIFMKYLSILCVGFHYTFDEASSLNIFQLFDLIERFGLKTAWEIDLKIRVAGGKPNSEPEDWMKDLHV